MKLDAMSRGSGPQSSWAVPGIQSLSRGLQAGLRPFRELRIRTGCLRGLDFLWLEITRSCNLTCSHCYAGSGPDVPLIERMGLSDWQGVLEDSRAVGCRRMQFIGGEPTLHPDLPLLIEHARKIGFREIEVFTNASRLPDDLLGVFRRFKIRIASSFYSADPETHNRITGRQGSFDRTVGGLRKLIESKIPLRVGVISLDQDAAQLRQTKRFLRRLGVRSIEVDQVRGIGRGHAFVPKARPESELCGHCWSGKLCIDANGNAYPCVFSRFSPVGNVLAGGLADVLKGGQLAAFRRQSYLQESLGG